jgi:hypothetical protein
MPDVRDLLDDPAAVERMSPAEAAAAFAELAPLVAALAERMAQREAVPKRAENGADGLVTVEQAAALAGVTVAQFYRRRAFRPAVVRLGHRTLRVNERKLRRLLGA